MYIRIYPSKNNTIFKRLQGTVLQTSGNINTGQNPILELHDGNSKSKIIMNFDISGIKVLLQNYNYSCNLKMFDAGVIYEPLLKDLKTIDLFYFTQDFVEGDGFSFLDGEAIEGLSNWNYRTFENDWTDCFSTGISNAFQLNSASDDIIIQNLKPFIDDAITNNKNPNFAIALHSNTPDVETYIKFIHGRRTRTIFTPYLEFFINDEILDSRRNIIATKEATLYLINQSKENFIGTLSCRIIRIEDDITLITIIPTNLGNGVYQIKYTPVITDSNKILKDIWSIDGVDIYSGIMEVKSPNNIVKENYDDLYFYPTTQYSHPLIRIGDIITFNLIAENRKFGSKLLPNFEYKVYATNAYEMQPWMPINLYKDKLYFTIDTSYYFPELEYEVFVRLKTKDFIRTSLMTYKFRITTDGPTHFANKAANPYNNRDYMAK
jgi:hypothetical protein